MMWEASTAKSEVVICIFGLGCHIFRMDGGGGTNSEEVEGLESCIFLNPKRESDEDEAEN